MSNNKEKKMKNNLVYKWIAPVLCILSLSSCLKNKNDQPDFSSVTPVVELPVNSPVGDGSVNSLSTSFTVAAEPSEFIFYVNYAAPAANASNLNVTLSVDPAALARYNAVASNDSLALLPSAGFSMATAITIPAGQRKIAVPIKISTSLLDPTQTYGLPITITDASGVVISKNFASLVVKIALKNIYDGKYTMKGNIVRGTDTDLGGYFTNVSRDLTTDGVNAVTFAQTWRTGANAGGIDGLTINVDPATNKVKMVSKANAALVNTPGYDNRYDPVSKTFYLSFYWGGGPADRSATDTLVYTGPR
jgi:hypothetical protein